MDVTEINSFEKDQVVTYPNSQSAIQDYSREIMTVPKTTITVLEANRKGYKFKIRQEGETQESPIRILYENLEHQTVFQDYIKGWQSIFDFNGKYDSENSEMILNCSSENMKLFIKRSKNHIKMTPKKFDLKKFITQTNYRIWGIWSAGHELHITKEGRFGYNIRGTNLPDDITAIDIAVEIDRKEVSITISNKGTISSQTKISITQLTEFYDEVKKYLMI
ncbi:MAG: hypothetical protein ACREBF_04770 [Candidatus Micrarchaeales archaeon]